MKKIYKRIISIALVIAIVVGIIISPLGEMLNLTKTAEAKSSTYDGTTTDNNDEASSFPVYTITKDMAGSYWNTMIGYTKTTGSLSGKAQIKYKIDNSNGSVNYVRIDLFNNATGNADSNKTRSNFIEALADDNKTSNKRTTSHSYFDATCQNNGWFAPSVMTWNSTKRMFTFTNIKDDAPYTIKGTTYPYYYVQTTNMLFLKDYGYTAKLTDISNNSNGSKTFTWTVYIDFDKGARAFTGNSSPDTHVVRGPLSQVISYDNWSNGRRTDGTNGTTNYWKQQEAYIQNYGFQIKYTTDATSYYSGISVKKGSTTDSSITGTTQFAILETTDNTHITAGMIAEARNFALQDLKAGNTFNYQGSMSKHWSDTFSAQYMPSFYSYTSSNGNAVKSNITKTTSNSIRYYWVFELTPPSEYNLNTDIFCIAVTPTTSTSGAGSAKITRYTTANTTTTGKAVSTTDKGTTLDNSATFTNANGTTLALLTVKDDQIEYHYSLALAKQKSDGTKVSGAKFNVGTSKGGSDIAKNFLVNSTTSKTVFSDKTYTDSTKTFYIKETEAPTGCTLNPGYWVVEMTGSTESADKSSIKTITYYASDSAASGTVLKTTATTSIQGYYTNNANSVSIFTATNDISSYYYSLNLLKENTEGDAKTGAKFKVGTTQGGNDINPEVIVSSKTTAAKAVDNYSSSSSTMTFYIKETEAPEGCVLNNGYWVVTMKGSSENGTKSTIDSIYYYSYDTSTLSYTVTTDKFTTIPLRGYISDNTTNTIAILHAIDRTQYHYSFGLLKQDTDGNAKTGAVFKVGTSKNTGLINRAVTVSSATDAAVVMTDYTNINKQITFYVTETKAPEGCEINPGYWKIVMNGSSESASKSTIESIMYYPSMDSTDDEAIEVKTTVTKNIQGYYIQSSNSIAVLKVTDEKSRNVSINLTKQPEDENCAVGSMAGTLYNIYYNENSNPNITINNYTRNSDGTSTRTVTTGLNTDHVGTFEVNSNGIGIVTYNTWVNDAHVVNAATGISTFYGKEGYYKIVEVKAPKNYGFDDSINTDVYHLTADSTSSITVSSEEPSPSDPLALIIKKKPSNLEAFNVWKNNGGDEADLSNIKSLDGTEFTVKFYKGYTSWGTSGLSAGISNGTITPDIELVYKVKNGKIDFWDDTYLDRIVTGKVVYNSLDEISFPIGILTVTETKATDGYSVKNNKWTDEQGNVYPAEADHFANGVGLVVRYSQDPEDIYVCKKEFMTGISAEGQGWIKADLISTSISGIPEFEVINPTHKADFTIIKTVSGAEMNGGAEINNEPLANVQFTAYYFYTIANELKALDSNNNGTSDWDEFVTALNSGDKSSYQTILDRYEATYSFVTDSNGKFESGDVPTGYYVIVEEECEANRGLLLANPRVLELNKDDSKTETIENIIPEIHTTEWDKELSITTDKTHMSNLDSDVYVMDTIRYDNLRPNTEYTFKAIIMLLDDQNNATILRKADENKNSIQKRVRFTTDSTGSGTIDMGFNSFDALHLKDADGNDITASGRKFVVYEFLFEGNQTSTALTGEVINQLITNTGNVTNAVRTNYGYVGHWSNTDTSQIGWFPKFGTTEKDSATLTKISPLWTRTNEDGEWVHVEDTLNYTLLDNNKTYTVFLEVRRYDNDSPIVEGKKYTLVPDSTGSGSILLDDIWFKIDDVTDMNKFYICETICKGNLNSTNDITDTNKVGTHDAKVESQTGYVAYIGTNASASSANGYVNNEGVYEAYAVKDVTLTDIVHAHNMMGLSVSITCTYRYITGEHAGEIVKDNKGNELTTTTTYTFDENKTDEDIEVVIEHRDLSNLKNETIVAYETITYKVNNEDIIIAKEHRDDSLTQMVAFVGIPVIFNKVDQRGNAVAGAKLEIRKDSLTGDKIEEWTTLDTESKVVELVEGKYYLIETQAPDDYALAEPIEFEVIGGKIIVNGTEQTELTITMIDVNLTELPTAGGIGTLWFTLSGLILILAAVLFKKKYIA